MPLVGWSLRSGGWPLSFGQHDESVAFDLAGPASPEFFLHNPVVFLDCLAKHLASDRCYDQVRQLQSGNVGGLGSQTQTGDSLFDILGSNETRSLYFQV